MYTNLFARLTIHVLSAGALATTASIDDRSSVSGTIGQDADLTVYTFGDEICTPPTLVGIDNVKLSWGMMQLTTGNTSSFTLSRSLEDHERLDWSTFAPDPADVDKARVNHVLPGCEHYLKSTSVDPVGKVLQPKTCIGLGMVANVSFLFGERATCTDQCLALVRECVGGMKG